MTFKYTITLTKTMIMPHGDRQYDYVYLTNNIDFIDNFIKQFKGVGAIRKTFKGKDWTQFYIKSVHYDMVKYDSNISISTTHRPLWKDVEMTEAELRAYYRGQYILDL